MVASDDPTNLKSQNAKIFVSIVQRTAQTKNGGLISPIDLENYLEMEFAYKNNNYDSDIFNYTVMPSPCSLEDGSFEPWLSTHQSKVHTLLYCFPE